MIRVDRGQPPDGFDELAAELRAGLVNQRATRPTLTASTYWTNVRRRLRPAAARLAAAFHGKCAYCESRIAPAGRAEIDHFRPQARPEYEAQQFTWDNWLLACPVCNSLKGDRLDLDGDRPLLIDPCLDEPAEHLAFRAEKVVFLTPRGRHTRDRVVLDRGDLAAARAQHLLLLHLAAFRAVDGDQACRDLLVKSQSAAAPYAAVGRSFVAATCPRLREAAEPDASWDDLVAAVCAGLRAAATELFTTGAYPSTPRSSSSSPSG